MVIYKPDMVSSDLVSFHIRDFSFSDQELIQG